MTIAENLLPRSVRCKAIEWMICTDIYSEHRRWEKTLRIDQFLIWEVHKQTSDDSFLELSGRFDFYSRKKKSSLVKNYLEIINHFTIILSKEFLKRSSLAMSIQSQSMANFNSLNRSAFSVFSLTWECTFLRSRLSCFDVSIFESISSPRSISFLRLSFCRARIADWSSINWD